MTFHRVYTHWDGDLWLGAEAAHKHGATIDPDREYVVLAVERHAPRCVLRDGLTLCDFGPDHEHRP